MEKKNIVFIAKSIDGYVAGKNGELDWLHTIPNPENNDMGYNELMEEIDAVVMGRTTFETVCRFEGAWSYSKHVFVLSTSLKYVPEELDGKVTLLEGSPEKILHKINNKGYFKLYIDGGRTVQDFIREDLIDELRITTMPIMLGGGFPLFGELSKPVEFEHVSSKVFLDQIVQNCYRRKK